MKKKFIVYDYKCSDCKKTGKIRLREGLKVSDEKCPMCGKKKLSKNEK